MNLDAKKAKYLQAKEWYYNNPYGKIVLSDREFDKLENEIKKADPKWEGLKKTGAPVGKKSSINLILPMPSLSKIKPESKNADAVLEKFTDVVISAKLDGSSIQAAYRGGKLVFLATRGDGEVGKDISHFIPHLGSSIPQTIKEKSEVVIRMEAVISKSVFKKKWGKEFDSARALSSSVFNRHDVHPSLKDVKLVVLRVLRKEGYHPMLSEGLSWAEKNKFTVVLHTHSPKVDVEEAQTYLSYYRDNYDYEVDGAVISSNEENLVLENKKPKWSIAFKADAYDEAPVTVIQEVEWQASAFGVLVPKARIKPVKFDNVTVTYCTLHNAKLAIENGHGVGAKVRVLRSGDIIPKIVETVEPAKFKLPSRKKFGDYEWDATKTNLVLLTPTDSKQAKAKALQRMFKHLEMKDFGESVALYLVDAGVDSTEKLMRLDSTFKVDQLDLPGFGITRTKALCNEVREVKNGKCTLDKLALASGCFDKGIGSARMKLLMLSHPELMNVKAWGVYAANTSELTIASTKGLGVVFARTFRKGATKFFGWLKATGVTYKVKTESVAQGKLTGMKVSWTGYRSKEEEAAVTASGGEVVSFSKKTSVLIFSDSGKVSSKVAKAKEAGIQTMTFDKFKLYLT